MNKDQFVEKRTEIISSMLDNPDKYGIYPTTKCFARLDDLFDQICVEFGQQPWKKSKAQDLMFGTPDETAK